MAGRRIDKSKYNYNAFLDAVKKWKTKNDYSDRDIANIVGVSQVGISNFLRGGDDVSEIFVHRVAEVTGIDLSGYRITRQPDSVFDFHLLRDDVNAYITKQGISQAKFAKTSGVPVQTINNFLTGFHTALKEQTVRQICGAINKPYTAYLKDSEPTFRWREDRNLWEYRFMLNGTNRTVYGKTKQECEERAEREINEALRKMDDKVEVAKCPDGNCRIDITEVYRVVDGVIRDALEKTFEQFLEKHLGEYKRRKRWN